MEPGMVSTRSILLACILWSEVHRRERGWKEERKEEEWLCSGHHNLLLSAVLQFPSSNKVQVRIKWSIIEANYFCA
jgi:hypothetical protein